MKISNNEHKCLIHSRGSINNDIICGMNFYNICNCNFVKGVQGLLEKTQRSMRFSFIHFWKRKKRFLCKVRHQWHLKLSSFFYPPACFSHACSGAGSQVCGEHAR